MRNIYIYLKIQFQDVCYIKVLITTFEVYCRTHISLYILMYYKHNNLVDVNFCLLEKTTTKFD